jgi:MYXO-CTERM domain-containing protein
MRLRGARTHAVVDTLVDSRERVRRSMMILSHRRGLASLAFLLVALGAAGAAHAAPPAPSGGHPRLFLNPTVLAKVKANATVDGSAMQKTIAACADTIKTPQDYTQRGGSDGSTWPGAAVACAAAWQATGDAKYATQAIKYWRASLEDDQNLGDKLGCVVGANGTWDGNGTAPPGLITITHDTGYPIRWYGPFVALTYDWMFSAPGVDEPLRAQTRTCMGYWIDWYSKSGYHHDEAGANYNAGFVAGKTFAAIAMAGELAKPFWAETVDDVFGKLLVGQGLKGQSTPDAPAGALVGGDWAEGWQYGPLSAYEYAMSARALEESGAPQPEMDAWASSLVLRLLYATEPGGTGQFPGGDYDDETTWIPIQTTAVNAIRGGPSSQAAAEWAQSIAETNKLTPSGFVYDVIAETREAKAVDFAASPRPTFYLARGTGNFFARTSWKPDAFWGVFHSSPMVVSDHEHLDATNFVLTRGADPIIVDPSPYGARGTLNCNAATLDSDVVTGDYKPSQTPWSEASLAYARGTSANVFAARGDYAKAFIFSSDPSDIPYAVRDWAMLPEGEVVIVDRATTKDASHVLHVNLHTRTTGLTLANGVASGTAGSSKVAIHALATGGATPTAAAGEVGDCFSGPYGACVAGRFPHFKYSVSVPGPSAYAVHVIDALGASEAPAEAAAFTNGQVTGANVLRGSQRTFVLVSSAPQGNVGATMTYAVPSAARHVVFDAPADAAGHSNVTAAAQNGECAITITAGPAFTGRPLVFGVSSPADGCKVTEDAPAAGGDVPGGGGVPSVPGSDAGAAAADAGESDGCGCSTVGLGTPARAGILGVGLAILAAARRRRRRRR